MKEQFGTAQGKEAAKLEALRKDLAEAAACLDAGEYSTQSVDEIVDEFEGKES